MTHPHLFRAGAFTRLCCYVLCYSLIAPFIALPGSGLSIAGAVAKPPVKAKNILLKTDQAVQKARWHADEMLVRFHESSSASNIEALLQANGAQRAGRLRGPSGIERLRLPAGSDPEAVAAVLRASPLIDLAEPNYLITADQLKTQPTPDDPRFSEQSALKNTGAQQAWATTTGAKQTVIAVIDSGIDFTHPDLNNNEWGNSLERVNNRDDDGNDFTDDLHGWDFVRNSAGIKDEQGHGTAVAGIIAAQGNNATGITGVMWQASLMSLRVLDNTGTGDVAGAVEALDYATQNGAQVINCSWGTDGNSVALLEAISRAAKRGVLVVTSAGNNGLDIETSPRYPASFDLLNVIAVASTDDNELLATFSNWGTSHVSIAAPGKDILTTRMGGDYQTVSGSSASAPFVSGVVGLVKSLRPWLDADRTREMILRGARQVAALSDKVQSKGIASAAGALETLNTLPPGEGFDETSGSNGGEHGDNGDGLDNQPGNHPGRGNSPGYGRMFRVEPPARTQGAPGSGLPNLDELRRKQPSAPKAPAPIPSTRCSHDNPDCLRSRAAAEQLPTELLASNSEFRLPEFLDYSVGRLISDSAPHLNLARPTRGLAADHWPNNKSVPYVSRASRAMASMALPPMALAAQQSSTNLALNRTATQSSIGYGAPGRAVDGNTSGSWANNSVSHTDYDYQAWWHVDLGSVQTIDQIKVWNRTDCCGDRLSNFYVFVSNVPFTSTDVTTTVNQAGVSSYYTAGVPGVTTTINVGRTGQYVRVQLASTNYLQLAEVEVWGQGSGAPDFATPRVDPLNRAGSGGVDLLSRNANWSLPILGLKGRAGLDLGLGLTYNSLVWTKSQNGSSIKFDADRGFPGPGFRLGFPSIQTPYYNSQVGVNAYLLITPSGDHIELRQVGATNVYEAADSSYLQLIDNGGGSLTLRPTDGSQLSYALLDGQYQCTQLKDRNGNYISISYYTDGRINTITDTLGRAVTFNYDGYLHLISITQNWGGVSHQWATFGWGNLTVSTSFSGLSVVGPQNEAVVPVLTQVAFADGTRYNFEYNAYAQVTLVRHYAADNHQLSYTLYTMPASSSDCPRVTEQREWAEYWNSNIEALTTYSTASDYSSGQMTMPDSTIYKELYATSGWQRGLATGSEFWSASVKKKWTTTAYTQDDTTLNYSKNPRPYDMSIYDEAGNRRRTDITYLSYGLPYEVREYSADGSGYGGFLRRTYTDYNLGQAYLDRRVIGVVSAVHVFGESNNLVSKTVYDYDRNGEWLVDTPQTTVQHDPAYSSAYFTGRGNPAVVYRFDVYDPNNWSKTIASPQIGYDTNGSVVFTRDVLNHRTNISYTDSFSDSVNRNTYAYPTTLTDADNNSSSAQYNYAFGAETRTQGPPPAGQPQGAVRTFEYDAAGRISRVNNANNGAYRRWVYDPYGAVSAFDTLQSASPEAYSIIYRDGAGRVRATGGDNPNSTGGYRGQLTSYDVMGRVSQTTNPTEMSGGWAPVGDDAAGWTWTLQAYDWKGRPTLTTNPDGTTKQATYGGCGCAGGEVVTVRDEVGRYQRMTADVFGRPYRKEVLNWDQTVYSTTTNSYNAGDQLTGTTTQAASSGTTQTTILTYDGYGRLQTRQGPAQTSPTTYTYNTDDTVYQLTDGRGAVTTFGYNGRHLVTGISYSAPYGIAAAAPVTYGYDAAGNRTSMSDGQGSTTYSYDALSRLQSEQRHINALNRDYTLSYSYTLSGQLQSITDPFGSVINYGYDSTGRLGSVTGSAYANLTSYVSNIQYRAWGAVKSATYGDSSYSTTQYNSRLQPNQYRLWNGNATSRLREDFAYYDDGRLHTITDLDDTQGTNPPTTLRFMSRSYAYDHAGRVTSGGGSPAQTPFIQGYGYDAFNNLTSRSGSYGWQYSQTDTATYTNNKRTGWTYDADGRLTYSPANPSSSARTWVYNAAGQLISVTETTASSNLTDTNGYDGDAQLVSEVVTGGYSPSTDYLIRSSVLDAEVIVKLDVAGNRAITYVPAGGLLFARQTKDYYGQPAVEWTQRDSVGVTEVGTNIWVAAYDALGNYVALQPHPAPYQPPAPPTGMYGPSYGSVGSSFSNANNYSTGCMSASGSPSDCSGTMRQLMSLGFYSNLPGVYNDMGQSLSGHEAYVTDRYNAHYNASAGQTGSAEGSSSVYYGDIYTSSVTISAGEDFVEASADDQVSWDMIPFLPQNTQVVPLPDLRAGLEALLKKSKGDCGKYVQRLLDEAAKLFPQNPLQGKTVMELFEKISKQGGYRTDARSANTVSGDLSNTDGRYPATVHLLPWNTYGHPTAYQIDSANRNYIYGALHETLHLAGKGWLLDYQLAKAAYSIAGKKLPDTPISDYRAWSDRFDRELMILCPK
jgi:YD repeat-containing protein